jgi:hypothetical protein
MDRFAEIQGERDKLAGILKGYDTGAVRHFAGEGQDVFLDANDVTEERKATLRQQIERLDRRIAERAT